MAHPMRRKDRQLEREDCIPILEKGEYGVLSMVTDEGTPYGVPISYAYEDGYIYFHGAMTGYKLDLLRKRPQASFCVVTDTQVLPAEFTTNYQSVIAFGTMEELSGSDKEKGLLALIQKYSPAYLEEGKVYMAKAQAHTCSYRLHIEDMTGKARN